jgi:hypothetical protein
LLFAPIDKLSTSQPAKITVPAGSELVTPLAAAAGAILRKDSVLPQSNLENRTVRVSLTSSPNTGDARHDPWGLHLLDDRKPVKELL